MAVEPARFDLGALYRAVDGERQRQGLSWAALSTAVGVSVSTIRRYAVAADAEADGVLALVRWLGEAPERFIDRPRGGGEPLPAVGPGIVRVDMEQVAVAADDPSLAGGRTRTTIQRLAEVAARSGRTIASLTRLSEL